MLTKKENTRFKYLEILIDTTAHIKAALFLVLVISIFLILLTPTILAADEVVWAGTLFLGNGTISDLEFLKIEDAKLIYLNLSGTNANQNIDIGVYNLTLNSLFSNYTEIVNSGNDAITLLKLQNPLDGTDATTELEIWNDADQVGSWFATSTSYNAIPGASSSMGFVTTNNHNMIFGTLGTGDIKVWTDTLNDLPNQERLMIDCQANVFWKGQSGAVYNISNYDSVNISSNVFIDANLTINQETKMLGKLNITIPSQGEAFVLGDNNYQNFLFETGDNDDMSFQINMGISTDHFKISSKKLAGIFPITTLSGSSLGLFGDYPYWGIENGLYMIDYSGDRLVEMKFFKHNNIGQFGTINYNQTTGSFSFLTTGGTEKHLIFNPAGDVNLEPIGDIYITQDDLKVIDGLGGDVSRYFNASDWIFNAEVGTPNVYWQGFNNHDFDGNITAQNVFIPKYIFVHTDATIPVIGASVWTNITFDQEEPEIKKGITHDMSDSTNHTFTITYDGVYYIEYDFDVEDTSVAASNIDVAGRVVYVNGNEIIGSVFESDITKQGVEVEISHGLLAELLVDDVIVFQFVAEDADVQISTHGTFGDHHDSASIVIEKIDNLQ